jgi:hypothetical protein
MMGCGWHEPITLWMSATATPFGWVAADFAMACKSLQVRLLNFSAVTVRLAIRFARAIRSGSNALIPELRLG